MQTKNKYRDVYNETKPHKTDLESFFSCKVLNNKRILTERRCDKHKAERICGT